MSDVKFAILNIKKNFDNAKELKSSFITSIIGMCINNIAFIVIWYYFSKVVGTLNGWTANDIFGLYAFNGIAYGLVDTFFHGVNNIPSYISTGSFDKYLVTPKNTLLKVVTSSISTSAIGDLSFGIICFIIFAFISKLTLFQILISIFIMILISIIYFAFVLICMSISFYFMDGENISGGLSGMFLSTSMYHGGAFTGVLRIIFTFVMPSLFIGVIPVEVIKDISLINICFIILITIFWFKLAVMFFNKSLKKYESNNFFGFGG